MVSQLEWRQSQEKLQALVDRVDNLAGQTGYLVMTMGGPTVAADFVIDTLNIRSSAITTAKIENLAVTSAKINDLAVDKLTAGSLDVAVSITTGGSIQVGSGTKDSNLTGFIIDDTELVGQNSGTDQIILSASTGKLTAGAGNVTLDSGGLTFIEGTGNTSSIRWLTSGGVKKGYIYFDHNVSGDIDAFIIAYSDVSGEACQLSIGVDNTADDADMGIAIGSDGLINFEGSAATATLFPVGYSTTANPAIIGKRARGTQASPTAVLANDNLFGVGGRGRGATAFSSVSRARMMLVANENFTDAAQGTRIEFYTTADGGTTTSERMTIENDGNVDVVVGAKVDTIAEHTAAAGVTIDTVLLKDDIVECSKYQLNDSNTEITEDGSSNLSFKDAVAGTKTLTQLAATSAAGEGHITILPASYDSVGQGTWALEAAAAYYLYWQFGNTTNADGDNISYSVYLDAGTYTLLLVYNKFPPSGIVDIYIDAVEIASFDQYSAAAVYNVRGIDTGNVIATAGLKTLKIQVDGKNPSSSAYAARFIYIALWRTA